MEQQWASPWDCLKEEQMAPQSDWWLDHLTEQVLDPWSGSMLVLQLDRVSDLESDLKLETVTGQMSDLPLALSWDHESGLCSARPTAHASVTCWAMSLKVRLDCWLGWVSGTRTRWCLSQW